MPEQAPSETPIDGDRAVELEDVTATYAIYLGRRTDDPRQNVVWLGLKLSELLAAFVSSPEFVNIRNELVKDGWLADQGRLSASELTQADRWLSRIVPGHRPAPGVAWGDLLLAALTSRELIALADPQVDTDTLTILRQDAEARHEMRASLRDAVSFDVEGFLSSDTHRLYRGIDGGVDFDAPLHPNVPALVLLPLFTEGLEAIRKRGVLTLGDWLEDTQTAAMAGSLTHWLWDEPTYRQNRSLVDRDLDETTPGDSAFLDFLVVGDAARVSPHPLFCHHAYRILNAEAPPSAQSAFRHFVDGGQAADRRTSALFDPDFYLALHPQVRETIASGKYGSALEHFVRVGMAAGYGFSPDFDRDFYLGLYPDVVQTVAEGTLPSAEWHYVHFGAREGRAPNPFFNPRYYADRYPFIGDEMRRLGIATTLEHFLLLGRARGWRVNQPPAERPVALEDGKALFEKRGRRALGEIMDGAVAIPLADAPRLSVIVPVSGQADFTAGLLKSAAFALEILKSRQGFETEIIVIDNGSPDHTLALLAAVPAVRVERFAAPIGFPAAVNAGARVARGDILLVVNNDIEVAPDAFDRLVKALDDDLTVGVVGAKILLANETLQEVGAMLDRLGSTHGFGRGSEATDVRGARRVEVDYASGCFIGFRRTDFEALSGFDPSFSPGYFEDVDFSLRMKRDLGKVTVVDTGLCVTHYEHASFARGRPPGVNTALILRNRLRLKTAHAALFQGLEDGRPHQRATRSRLAMTGTTRVLVVEDMIPAARLGSGFGRQEAILDAFTAMGVAFDIVALNPSARIDSYKDARVKVFRAWMPGQSLHDVLRDQAGEYSHLWICRPHNLTPHSAAVAQARADFDLKVICDIEALSSQETVERTRLRGGAVDDDLALAIAADDLAEALLIDLWVAADDHDRTLLQRIGLGPVIQIGHPVRPHDEETAARPFAGRERILFVGTVSDRTGAAHDGLEWVLSEVWPLLAGLEGVRLTVAGAWAPDLAEPLIKRFGDRIDFIGEIDNARLAELYGESRVAIAPARFAAGPSGKVMEAIAAGVPTVMTDHVAGRMALADNPEIVQGRRDDGGRSFAEAVSLLYTDKKAWQAQITAQRIAMASQFEGEGFVGKVEAALTQSGKGPTEYAPSLPENIEAIQ